MVWRSLKKRLSRGSRFFYGQTLGMQFWTLRVTQGFCNVSWICSRLKSPFRPSATYFEGSKYAKSWLRFRPDFVGFLRPGTDPGVTYVALCVVSAIAVKKRFFNYRAT
ncbi:hypothetical protein ALQ32_05350, partial [Pseudomonas syringae pv. tagetis]